jgi:hypothetical protein
VLLDILLQMGYQRAAVIVGMCTQKGQQAVVAILVLYVVLGFVQTIGIDEQALGTDVVQRLAFIFQSLPET